LKAKGSRSRAKREFCPRCHIRITAGTKSCPKCGQYIGTRRVPIIIGIIGVLALVFVTIVMLSTAQKEEAADQPTVNLDDMPSPDATPVKPPPLNK
jgi:hypothetical protein